MSIEASPTNLIENIHLQRTGFCGLGSPFYDSLGEELATVVLADGPMWSIEAVRGGTF